MTNHRISVSLPPTLHDSIAEIARLSEVSVGHVVRDALRGVIPSMLEVTKFLHDPHTTNEGKLLFAEDVEAVLARVLGASDELQHGDARRFLRLESPDAHS